MRNQGEGRNSAFCFEDIAVLGNGANRMSTRSAPLLRMKSTKALFSSKLGRIHLQHKQAIPDNRTFITKAVFQELVRSNGTCTASLFSEFLRL